MGLPPILYRFIYSLIHARKLQFVVNGKLSDEYYTYKGVPQGSILSPILFNICNDAPWHRYEFPAYTKPEAAARRTSVGQGQGRGAPTFYFK